MLTMIIRKLLLGIFYLFVISVVAFVMVRQMPGDPAVLIANQDRESEAPPELVERIRQEYGFDKGIIEQYRLWLGRVLLEGNLGYSTRTKRPVLAEIKASFPPWPAALPIDIILSRSISGNTPIRIMFSFRR